MIDYKSFRLDWGNLHAASGVTFNCGHCGSNAGVITMMDAPLMRRSNNQPTGHAASVLICPVCTQPTYFDFEGKQIPAPRLGADLKSVPSDGLLQLYNEARDCSSVGAYTACVMACRKILMNLAVREGAKEGLGFVEYVDHLEKNGYTPKKGKDWVDRIRKTGNEANHQIAAKTAEEAKDTLHLVEMLLRFNFELGAPSAAPKPV